MVVAAAMLPNTTLFAAGGNAGGADAYTGSGGADGAGAVGDAYTGGGGGAGAAALLLGPAKSEKNLGL
jgi:hypothetical protein